ncbi:DNA-binding protein YbiB [Methylibium sp. Pch-M]|uniref:DNA-binding protein YbiB n=1 Tax=Methylibium sp. Pch-M TaxID=2082386 RepID=UPI00101189C9|nr:DNA-binding protein YbiB [Methylibium sp. Pch-M]QAZ40746.1 DNA-binding protein YbiB [Methylibium sp. Pch-M]
MGIAHYLKEIGRGKEGARSLTEAQARDLMNQVLDREVSEAERGAFAIAMRIKGESTEELAGFTACAAERSLVLEADAMPVLLPSYNGARKLPNLTPLLALLLAQEGVPVLVHGPLHDPARVTTYELFESLGLPIARDAAGVHDAWARHEPVFVPTAVLCPALVPLLELRWVLGLRNPAHTVAKLLTPRGRACLRVVNYTHPEYAAAHTRFLQHTGAHALLMRGTEGEPVADARRLPKLDVFIAGTPRPELGRAAVEGVLAELPLLPRSSDAATTAVYIQAVVSGEKPVPGPLVEQVEVLVRSHAAMRQHEERTHERSA